MATTHAHEQILLNNNIDKLVDANGKFGQQALPYTENFLEPYMDAETVHLHYTFHHGGATKAANTDLQKINEALVSAKFETVDYWTKNCLIICHLIYSIQYFGRILRISLLRLQVLHCLKNKNDFGNYRIILKISGSNFQNVDGKCIWGILGYQPHTNKLTVLQNCEKNEKLTQWG